MHGVVGDYEWLVWFSIGEVVQSRFSVNFKEGHVTPRIPNKEVLRPERKVNPLLQDLEFGLLDRAAFVKKHAGELRERYSRVYRPAKRHRRF